MPMMPRQNKKAENILYSIIGKPPALRDRRSAHKKRIDRMLIASEGVRSR